MAAVVVDTNVVACHVLGAEECRDLLSDPFLSELEFVAPDSLKAEILNVLWLAIRNRALTLEEAVSRLDSVEHLLTRSIPIAHPWSTALALAVESDHSPCDTLFIAAAEREGTKLLTYDRRLQHAFPATAVDPAAFRGAR